jgi:serine/threonine protein kinase/predicted  nucleic acid-binding Zn-ribbon protein
MSQRHCPKCGERFRVNVRTCPFDQTPLVEPPDPLIGRTIAGRYRIEERLGRGGMSNVYRARHQVIGRDVALKFLSPEFAQRERSRARFLREARATNQVKHEHIVQITDFGETEDKLVYMVMQYLEGRTLADLVAEGPLRVARALRIALQIARGLAQAHELAVVHRDIKPHNVFLIRDQGTDDFVKILDFGLAYVQQDVRLTVRGQTVGTPAYIAPEQITSHDVVAASDLYALGCVLFELLTGRVPFEGLPTNMMVQHLEAAPPRPSTLCQWLPRSVDRLVLKLLQKKPELRHRDAYHLAEDLEQVLREIPDELGPDQPLAGADHAPPVSNAPPPGDRLLNRVRIYERVMKDVYRTAPAPDWVVDAVARMTSLVQEIWALRGQLQGLAQKATAQEQQAAHSPAVRIGYALDELAKDASRVAREMDELRTQLEAAESQVQQAVTRIAEGVGSVPPPVAAGQATSEQEAAKIREVMQGAAGLAQNRKLAAELREQLQHKRNAWEDLRSQIDQLKKRMLGLHDHSSAEMQLAQEEVSRVEHQIQEKLDTIAELSEQLGDHFREQAAGKAG